MRLFLNDKEATLAELKDALDNLDYGPPDGGAFETLVLNNIDEDDNMYFDIEKYSTFGG